MNTIKKIFLSLFALQLLFAIRAEYVEIYYDKGNPYVLCRPRINNTNTIISAELYTTVSDYKQGDNKNKIIFFERSDYTPYTLHNGLDDITETIIQCNAGLVSWSGNESKPWFFSSEYINSAEGGQYGKENMTFGNILAINPSQDEFEAIKKKAAYFDIDGLIVQRFQSKQKKSLYDINDIPKMFNVDDLEVSKIRNLKYLKFEMPTKSNKEHRLSKFPERLFYLYRDTLQTTMLKSNAPNYADNDGKVLPNQSVKILLEKEERYEDTLKLKLSLVNFDVVQKYRKDWRRILSSYNVVIQENGGDYQNRVYFLCHTEGKSNEFIPLFYSKESEKASQVQPMFNYNGDKISFLTKKENKLYDLHVVDINDCPDCSKFSDNYKDAPLDLEYIKIATNLVGSDNWLDLHNYNSYCWHPNKNIIFYIKKELDDKNEDTYPIYYYNFNTKKTGKVRGILTEYNKYLSVSDDGNYLLFSFSGTMSGVNSQNYSFRNSNDKDAYNPIVHSIGVAKLIYD